MALERDQTLLPAPPVLLLLAAERTVPVQELKVTLQYGLDLHLPLGGAAGVQQVDHRRQAPQRQPRQQGAFGFGGDPAAPRTQNREQVLHGLRADGEKTIFLKKQKQNTGRLQNASVVKR